MITFFYFIISIFLLLVTIGMYNKWRDNRKNRAHEAYKIRFLNHIKDLGLNPENLCGHVSDGVTMFPNQVKKEITSVS